MAGMAMGEAAMVTPVDMAMAGEEATGTPADTGIATGADRPTTAGAAMAEGEAITAGEVMRALTGVAGTMAEATAMAAAMVMAEAMAAGISEGPTVTALDFTASRMHSDTVTRLLIVIRPATTITGVAGFRIPVALCLTATSLALPGS